MLAKVVIEIEARAEAHNAFTLTEFGTLLPSAQDLGEVVDWN